MSKKFVIACLVSFITFLLSGCGNNYMAEYDFGVIYTAEYKNKSQISFFDEKMEEVNGLSYYYPNISYDGFSNALIVDDELYLLPKGHADKLDYGKIISLDLFNGKIKEYDFNRTNVTSFDCACGFLCVSSNLNAKNYIDVYDMETEKIQTMELENVLVNSLVINENTILGVLMDLETDEYFLCEFNVSKDEYTVLYKIPTEPEFMEIYQGKLYFPNDNILYEYDIQSKTMNEIKLSHTNAYNLQLVDDMLYIGYTDIFNGEESYVDIMHLPDRKIVKSIKYDGIIVQMEISKADRLYILDYDKLSLYDISKEEPILSESIMLEASGEYYVGGFYLNEIKK